MLVTPFNFMTDDSGVGSGGGSYTVQAVNFDGSNDYLTRGADLTGNANSKLFSCSFWIKRSSVGTVYYLAEFGNALVAFIRFSSSNILRFYGTDTVGGVVFVLETSSAIGDTTAWHHVCASGNTGVTNSLRVYVDGIDRTSIVSQNTTPQIDWTNTEHSIGSRYDGSSKIPADIAEFWWTNTEEIDFSVQANREKFRSATGKPVNLGSDGSTPTGTAPLIYLHTTEPNWHVNAGSGGGFTENGALTTASTSPSD